ncbi:DUF5711 family protein [Gemmiger sp.]
MNKSDKERLARRKRMLAKEQGQAPEAGILGTSGDISLRTPKPVRRGAPPPKAPDDTAGETAARLKSLTPLYKQRQHRRRVAFGVIIAVLAVAVVVLTGTLSASLAMLGDAVDSAVLYLNRTDGGWPATTGITEPLQIEPLAGGFVELGAEDVLVYSPYGSKILSIQPSYARPVLAVGGTHFVVYNRAGSELMICSRTRTLYSQSFDAGILLCAMSDNNSLAVVTESSRYAAQVRVFDASLRQLYSWEMTQSEGTPIALDFAPDSRRFAAGMLAARDGQISCTVNFMSLDSDSEGPVYTADQGSMLLRLDWQSEGRVMAVFDTYAALLDPRTGAETARYDYGGATLQSAAPGRRQTALLLNVRGGNSLVTLSDTLAPLAEIPARQATGVAATDTDIYLLCPDAVECYGYDGVQKWVRRGLDARPLAVINAAKPLVFTGSKVEVLEGGT